MQSQSKSFADAMSDDQILIVSLECRFQILLEDAKKQCKSQKVGFAICGFLSVLCDDACCSRAIYHIRVNGIVKSEFIHLKTSRCYSRTPLASRG